MAWSFHAIDTRLPRILRLLDGVQVDNLTHCLISTQASTGGCDRRGCWLARRVLRTVINMANRTRWRRTGRRPSTMAASRSNWPATASRATAALPPTYLACRTRRRCTPGALILDRGRRRKSGRSWLCMLVATATARSRISGRRSLLSATRRTLVKLMCRTTDIGCVACAACPACAGLSRERRSASSRAATRRTGNLSSTLPSRGAFRSCFLSSSQGSLLGSEGIFRSTLSC